MGDPASPFIIFLGPIYESDVNENETWGSNLTVSDCPPGLCYDKETRTKLCKCYLLLVSKNCIGYCMVILLQYKYISMYICSFAREPMAGLHHEHVWAYAQQVCPCMHACM